MKTTDKPKRQSLTKLQRLQRKKKREERQAQRLRDAEDLKYQIERAKGLIGRIPAEFSEWGVIKTRAYKRLQEITRRRISLKHPKLEVVRECVRLLDTHAAWSIQTISRLSVMPETAAKF